MVRIPYMNHAPFLPLRIFSRQGEFESNFRVDSGFDGPLLVPEGLFVSWGLESQEFGRNESPILETASGELLRARGSLVFAEFEGSERFLTQIWATQEIPELLAGLEFINSLVLLLDGPSLELEITTF